MNGLFTDYHCHILPELDDGAKNVSESISMVQMMQAQGIENIIATPHFYPQKGITIDEFLFKREQSYNNLRNAVNTPIDFNLGAEVYLVHDISNMPEIKKLHISGSSFILFEMPFVLYEKWIEQEIYNISFEHKLTPIIAHLDRYMDLIKLDDLMDLLLSTRIIVQINYESVLNRKVIQLIKYLLNENVEIVFGTDAHGINHRPPEINKALKILQKKLGKHNYKKIVEINKNIK